MKTIVSILVTASAISVLAAEKFDKSPEAIAARKAKFIETTGGFIEKPGTAKGKLVIFNAQKEIGNDSLKPALEYIKDNFRISTKISSATNVTFSSAEGIVKNAEANVAVFIADLGENIPALMTSPDQKWAMVNTGSLGDARTSQNVCKEIVRGFAYVSGAATSQANPTLMSPFDNIKLLNGYPDIKLPADVAMRVRNGLTHIGIVPYKIATYLNACKEGWAPAPTNETQKAIWNGVHAAPAAPLEIKFDPKSGSGKITQKK